MKKSPLNTDTRSITNFSDYVREIKGICEDTQEQVFLAQWGEELGIIEFWLPIVGEAK